MEKDYWLKRWKNNDVSFDQVEPHRYFKKYFDRLSLKEGDIIFFPLCGKSIDMSWVLQNNRTVLGVELSEIPIKSFFDTENIKYSIKEEKNFRTYYSEDCQIIQADIFQLAEQLFSHVHAIYDRGCFVALPPSIRKKYVEWVKTIFSSHCKMLIITFDFDQDSEVLLPPFPTNQKELNQLFGDLFFMECLDEEKVIPKEKWKGRGMRNLKESVFLLESRS